MRLLVLILLTSPLTSRQVKCAVTPNPALMAGQKSDGTPDEVEIGELATPVKPAVRAPQPGGFEQRKSRMQTLSDPVITVPVAAQPVEAGGSNDVLVITNAVVVGEVI